MLGGGLRKSEAGKSRERDGEERLAVSEFHWRFLSLRSRVARPEPIPAAMARITSVAQGGINA
jgi:hypothetical protein